MAIFKRSKYTFKIENSAYINALITCVGQLGIDKLKPTFDDLSFNDMRIEQLPQLIEKIKEKQGKNIELTLETHFGTLFSLDRVLPEFEPQDSTEDPELQSTVSKIQSYIERMTNKTNDLYLIPPELPTLTREQALAVLNSAYKQASFFSAIDIPSQNSILIFTQCGNHLFGLHYGPEKTKIEDRNIYFDIDDGFASADNYDVPKELTDAFDAWLKNNRQGTIFAPPKKKLEMLSQEISQHSPLVPELANIIADYAYTPNQPKLKQRPHVPRQVGIEGGADLLPNKKVKASASQILNEEPKSTVSQSTVSQVKSPVIQESTIPQAATPVSQVKSPVIQKKHKLLLAAVLAVAVTGAAFALLGFAPIIILYAVCIASAAVIFGESLLHTWAQKKARHYIQTEENNLVLTPDETVSFEAGVKAGESYKGFFNSWTVKQSYTNYSAYSAGKELAEAHTPVSEATINKIKHRHTRD